MPSFGRQVLGSTGRQVMVTADGSPEWVTGGISVDWATVAAEASDRTLVDGTVIKAGAKGLEFGTILCEIATPEVQILTIDAGGGTYTLAGNSAETGNIAEAATAAVVQSAIRSLAGAYAQAAVAGDVGGPYTITFPFVSGDVAALVPDATNLTGGAGTAVITTSTAGTSTGYYGPFKDTATDGRQTLVRGRCCVLNESVVQLGPLGIGTLATDHPPVFDGGKVMRARLKIGMLNPTSIGGNAPDVAAFETAFPRVSYVDL